MTEENGNAQEKTPLAVKQSQHAEVLQSNLDQLAKLGQTGVGVTQESIYFARFNFFIEWLIGKDPELAVDFELAWEQCLSQLLKESESEARKKALLAGVRERQGSLGGDS